VSKRFEERRKQQLEQERLERGRTPQQAKRETPTEASKNRWQTLNQFVDLVAPVIAKNEVLVWLLLFRHSRNGTVETSERRIAAALRLTRTSAGRALRGLTAGGFVWPIYRSTSKGACSKYGLHPNPAACIARNAERNPRNRAHDAPNYIKHKGPPASWRSAGTPGKQNDRLA